MRSTRAIAAVARLNQRLPEGGYSMSLTGAGLCILNQTGDHGAQAVSEPLPLDEFVRHVNALGPQAVRRMTKSDIAFEKQLVKKHAP